MKLPHGGNTLAVCAGMRLLIIPAGQREADGHQLTLLLGHIPENSLINGRKSGILGKYLHWYTLTGGIQHGTHRQADGITGHRVGTEREEYTHVLKIFQILVNLILEDMQGIALSIHLTKLLRTADKAALNEAITAAETFYNSIKAVEDYSNIAATLYTAIDNAYDVADSETADQDEVDAATTAITTAKTNAEVAKKDVDDTTEANKVSTQIADLPAKEAITKELEREGQVFYIYNRVEDINMKADYISRLVPEARVAFAHGRMTGNQIEDIMQEFVSGNTNVLVCTTILESGIDIPNANTMIIHNSDKFGLAQLYQLRGRVGRSQRQAYCYCFYTKSKEITPEAVQRLKAIKEFTTLGSGYQIAMRDVEIRGVGNILGTKQHGHMVNVGFDTYCQLLDETVKELQGETVEKKAPTIVDINVTAFIPDEWVGSKEQKMIEYKRLADVHNETELGYIESEWKDRFSKIPEEVSNLIKLVQIRLAGTKVGITTIR